ncbi:MAG: DedA family protein [Acidimicrobiales bacterium]
MLASIVTTVTGELHRLSPGLVVALVALLVFGEAALFIGFVLPGETSVIVAGVIASQGRLNVGVLCAVVVAAAVVGDTVGYEVGRRFGPRLLERRVFERRRAALERALAALERRGPTFVFIGRFTAFLRAVTPGLAGLSGMAYRRFLLANAAGGLIWGVAYTLLGYFAGHALSTIERWSSWFALGVLVLVVAAVVVVHLRRRARERDRPGEVSAE